MLLSDAHMLCSFPKRSIIYFIYSCGNILSEKIKLGDFSRLDICGQGALISALLFDLNGRMQIKLDPLSI